MFLEQQISILKWFLKDHWSNDDENWALNHRNKLNLKIYSNRKECLFSVPFGQINVTLVSITDFFQKTYWPQYFALKYFQIYYILFWFAWKFQLCKFNSFWNSSFSNERELLLQPIFNQTKKNYLTILLQQTKNSSVILLDWQTLMRDLMEWLQTVKPSTTSPVMWS